MKSSLYMPIAIGKLQGKETEKESKRAEWIIKLSNLGFYLGTLAWFLGSAITGKFAWRMLTSLPLTYVFTIFLISLARIEGFISKFDTRQQYKPNYRLVIINKVIFIFELLVQLLIVGESFFVDSDAVDSETEFDCRVSVSITITYWLSWIANILSTSITSYMNLNFS